MGGVSGVRPARVVVIGAGMSGLNAAWIAQGMEAEVVVLDKNINKLREIDRIHQGRILTLASNRLVGRRGRDLGRPRDRRGSGPGGHGSEDRHRETSSRT